MYMLCRGQVILGGMSGVVVDLNFPAVFETMRIFGVKDIQKCFNKVKRVFDYIQQKEFEEREERGTNT